MRWFYISLFVAFVACNTDNKTKAGQATAPVSFRFNPETGKKYSYTIVSESTMQQEVDGKDIDSETRLEIRVTYQFEKDTASGFLLTMHYDAFKLYAKALGQEKELDAATASLSFDPADKMFAAFHNASITAHVDSLGNVSALSGTETIKSRMQELAGNDLDALQMLNGSIRQYVSDAFFKQSAEGSLKILTDKKMQVGDTLQLSSVVGGDFNISAKATHMLASINENIATVKLKGAVDITGQQLKVENTNVVATIKGEQTGENRINTLTGMSESMVTETNLKGTMQLLGREVPFKMKVKNSSQLNTD